MQRGRGLWARGGFVLAWPVMYEVLVSIAFIQYGTVRCHLKMALSACELELLCCFIGMVRVVNAMSEHETEHA
jgi:hypothetical protein